MRKKYGEQSALFRRAPLRCGLLSLAIRPVVIHESVMAKTRMNGGGFPAEVRGDFLLRHIAGKHFLELLIILRAPCAARVGILFPQLRQATGCGRHLATTYVGFRRSHMRLPCTD